MDLGSFFNAMGIAKKEYSRSLEPVCKRFGLTQNELAVLLFLGKMDWFLLGVCAGEATVKLFNFFLSV